MSSLGFLHPLFLFGLAAGVLPILIHRLTLRKPLVRKFAAVHLLIQSRRNVALPQRLKHLLLLILRILAVVSVVLLMAQPVLWRHGLLAMGEEGAQAIILDNSLSMGYQEERGERFLLAKKAAREVIEKAKGQILLIPLAPPPGGSLLPEISPEISWKKPEDALKELGAMPLSFGKGDPAAALGLAFRQLQDFKGPKEILVITDLTRGDWEGFQLGQLGVVATEVGITFLRIGGENRDPNFAVKGVRLVAGGAVTGIPSRLDVTVANFSNQPGSPLAQMVSSGIKVDQKALELKADEDGKVFMEFLADRPGWVNGEIRLSGDRLPCDDVFYFPLKVREKVKVLIVDGDPRTSLRASESYYILHALRPQELEGAPFVTRVIPGQELPDLDLNPYEAIFLLNVAKPPALKLASFMESGRPMFIFLGDRVAPEDYNRFPLFPWRLQEVKNLETGKPLRITRIDQSLEALKVLVEAGEESLRGASFRRYFPIAGSRKNLLTLENQDPLLVEGSAGKGRVFLFASSADLDWNDLPLKAAYLPLIQGLLKEAIGLGKDSFPALRRFGEPFQGKDRATQMAGPPGGPGIYQSFAPSGELRQGVNPPLEESDLRKVSPGEMQKKFGSLRAEVVEYREGFFGQLQAGRKELWPYLLAFLLTVIAVEMGVANRL